MNCQKLNPAVAYCVVICITAVIAIFIWQMWKTFRES